MSIRGVLCKQKKLFREMKFKIVQDPQQNIMIAFAKSLVTTKMNLLGSLEGYFSQYRSLQISTQLISLNNVYMGQIELKLMLIKKQMNTVQIFMNIKNCFFSRGEVFLVLKKELNSNL